MNEICSNCGDKIVEEGIQWEGEIYCSDECVKEGTEVKE